MNDCKIFCMCLHDHHLQNLKKLKYTPVGLGKNNFSDEWIRDNTKVNISHKNKYYGEYTFYYWFWKNVLNKISNGTWIGFTGYRYHWSQKNDLKSEKITKLVNENNFENYVNPSSVIWQEVETDYWKKFLKNELKDFLKETNSQIAKKITDNFENELQYFKQVCPIEMLDKLENPITLKTKIKKVS